MHLLLEEFAGYAKDALEEMKYDEAKDFCQTANNIQKAIADAREKLEKKEKEDAETE